MIHFQNVHKSYHLRNFEKTVLTDLTFTLRRDTSLGICGANGAGKSTLMRLIAGVEHPSAGRISRTMTISWPIGYSSAFQSSLTGADNVRFIARAYRRKASELLDFVEDFAQLGRYFHQPVKTYSMGMSARLAFGVSLAIDFDCYLIDEITAAGDERFRQRCSDEIQHRADHAGLVMVSHDADTLRRYCHTGAVLRDGRLTFFDTIDEAIEIHHAAQSLAA